MNLKSKIDKIGCYADMLQTLKFEIENIKKSQYYTIFQTEEDRARKIAYKERVVKRVSNRIKTLSLELSESL